MERAGDVEAVVLDALDRREALMAERLIGKFLQRARVAVVEQLCIGLEQRRPRFAVTLLQCLDGCPDRGVGEEVSEHGQSPSGPNLCSATSDRLWRTRHPSASSARSRSGGQSRRKARWP